MTIAMKIQDKSEFKIHIVSSQAKGTKSTCSIYSAYGMKQAFRFIVDPGHCPMISKYGPSHSKAVGLVDPSFLGVKKISLE